MLNLIPKLQNSFEISDIQVTINDILDSGLLKENIL